jgi:short-subunit dehydrogenase
MSSSKLAIVTGASSGIGLEIAKLAAQDGYDLIVAADTPFVEAGPALKEFGVQVQEVEADLSTKQGVDQLLAKVGDRAVDVLVANAGHGLGHGFLDRPRTSGCT